MCLDQGQSIQELKKIANNNKFKTMNALGTILSMEQPSNRDDGVSLSEHFYHYICCMNVCI